MQFPEASVESQGSVRQAPFTFLSSLNLSFPRSPPPHNLSLNAKTSRLRWYDTSVILYEHRNTHYIKQIVATSGSSSVWSRSSITHRPRGRTVIIHQCTTTPYLRLSLITAYIGSLFEIGSSVPQRIWPKPRRLRQSDQREDQTCYSCGGTYCITSLLERC